MAKNPASNLDPPAPVSYETLASGKIAPAPGADDEVADSDANTDPNSIECYNVSSNVVKFEIHGVRYALKPKQSVLLHRAYALPRKMHKNRDPIPSVVEMQTSKRVLPITDPRCQAIIGARE